MLDTTYLFQPRGPGTQWFFRIATPSVLVGRPNTRTGKPYRPEVRESTKSRDLKAARRVRNVYLANIERDRAAAIQEIEGSLDTAMQIAADYRSARDGQDEALDYVTSLQAEKIEERAGYAKAKRWHEVATGEATPLKLAYEKYLADEGKEKSRSSLNNLATAIREFCEFAGEDVSLQGVDRRTVGDFVKDYLPTRKGPKAPEGQGPATIRRKVSDLKAIWEWAKRRGYLDWERHNPWEAQAPSAKVVKAAANTRNIYTPEQTTKLLEACPEGTRLGDLIRVALLTGVRLEEVADLEATRVDPEGRWYEVQKGKTDNAARTVPLVDLAQTVIRERLRKAGGQGPLFPELPVRPSTGKRGGAASQEFTRVRREVLGRETDKHLDQHAFRHTWRTAAGRAGVDTRVTQEMGGWSKGRASDLPYDHGRELEQYREDQERVARWLREKGYLG